MLFLAIGCQHRGKKKPFAITALQVGQSSYSIYEAANKDHITGRQLPIPPFRESVVNNGFLEHPSGKIYFYSFQRRQSIFGYGAGTEMIEAFLTDLDSLQAKKLILVDTNNLPRLVKTSAGPKEVVAISIGIQNNKSRNKVLLHLANRFYQYPTTHVWKVRSLLLQEIKLLAQFPK